jgi:haloalkane dehalogenase
VEKPIPAGTATTLSDGVTEHYRRVQPTPEARAGVARMPKEILAARPLLERLARGVPEKLGAKPALLVWGMKDFAFRPGSNLPRMRSAFGDHELVELPDAKHYIQEDAPERITEAIRARFG